MRNKFRIVLALLAFAVLGAFVLYSRKPQKVVEPLYAGYPASYWMGELSSPDWMTMLERLSNSAAPLLVTRLETQDSLYGKMHSWIAPHAPWLAGFLPKPDLKASAHALGVRRRAAEILDGARFEIIKICPAETNAVDAALFVALWDEDGWVRNRAASALRASGGLDKQKLKERLYQLLDDPDVNVHAAAFASLKPLGLDGAIVIPKLARDLQSSNFLARQAAASALGGFGPLAMTAVPALRQNLLDGNEWNRLAAANALWQIDREEDSTIPIFIQALASSHGDDQVLAASTLGQMGTSASNAVPALLHGLSDEERRVREAYSNALLKISPQALAAAPPQTPEPLSHFADDATSLNYSQAPSRTIGWASGKRPPY